MSLLNPVSYNLRSSKAPGQEKSARNGVVLGTGSVEGGNEGNSNRRQGMNTSHTDTAHADPHADTHADTQADAKADTQTDTQTNTKTGRVQNNNGAEGFPPVARTTMAVKLTLSNPRQKYHLQSRPVHF